MAQKARRRILLTGKTGQVGGELLTSLAPLGRVMALGRSELDLTDSSAIRAVVRDAKPDLIVNAAAYTQVDKAESEQALACAINATAPGVLAEEAARLGATIVHYSTDYVFDGRASAPYSEEDTPAPATIYGETKLQGEQAVLGSDARSVVLRLSWVYGLRGGNFLLTMLRLGAERDELRVVSDQIGAPTWSRDIAEASAKVAARLLEDGNCDSGLFHMTAGGAASWYEFANRIFELGPSAHRARVSPIPTHEYPTPAKRPAYSVLSGKKLRETFDVSLRGWEQQLEAAMHAQAAERG